MTEPAMLISVRLFSSILIDARRQKCDIRLDSHPLAHGILPHNKTRTMWPVMTLTLLLQLTDDEQLFAQEAEGTEAATEIQATEHERPEAPAAAWPAEGEADC